MFCFSCLCLFKAQSALIGQMAQIYLSGLLLRQNVEIYNAPNHSPVSAPKAETGSQCIIFVCLFDFTHSIFST